MQVLNQCVICILIPYTLLYKISPSILCHAWGWGPEVMCGHEIMIKMFNVQHIVVERTHTLIFIMHILYISLLVHCNIKLTMFTDTLHTDRHIHTRKTEYTWHAHI